MKTLNVDCVDIPFFQLFLLYFMKNHNREGLSDCNEFRNHNHLVGKNIEH